MVKHIVFFKLSDLLLIRSSVTKRICRNIRKVRNIRKPSKKDQKLRRSRQLLIMNF